jgi:biotin carboxylase
VVVDPIKSGADLRNSLREVDAKVIDVYTLDREFMNSLGVELPNEGEHICSDDARQVAARLEPWTDRIQAVIPASEPATAFVARLARLLHLPSNHDPDPERFRNKEAMRKHAHAAGVRVPAFFGIERGRDFEFPQSTRAHILKPLRAAGADAVKIVSSKLEVQQHMTRCAHDLFGNENTRWLLEEYVTGPEFAINTVSSGGRHQTIDIWEYCQPGDGASKVYDNPYWNVLQIDKGRVWDELSAFAAATLERFAVEFGFCHIEVKIDLHSGCVYLIEIASRLPGAGMPWMWKNIWGMDVYSDLGSLYGGRGVSLARYMPPPDAPLLGLVFIRNERAGMLQRIEGLEELRSLSGCISVDLYAQPGQPVEITDTLQNPLAKVMVKATDRRSLEAVADKVRGLIIPQVA